MNSSYKTKLGRFLLEPSNQSSFKILHPILIKLSQYTLYPKYLTYSSTINKNVKLYQLINYIFMSYDCFVILGKRIVEMDFSSTIAMIYN